MDSSKTPKRIAPIRVVNDQDNLEELTGDINKIIKENSSEVDNTVSFTRSGKIRDHSDRRNVQTSPRTSQTSPKPLSNDNDMPDLTCTEVIHLDDPIMTQQFLDFLNNKR
jgi:hypothetical protein